MGGDVLTKLWSFEDVAGGDADKLVRGSVNIEDEKPASFLDVEDETEDRSLLENRDEIVG